MQSYINPPKSDWSDLLQRPRVDVSDLYEKTEAILAEIQQEGDAAVRRYSERFDGYRGAELEVTQAEITQAETALPEDLKAAIRRAADNIEKFHASQWQPMQKVETQTGVTCWQKSVPKIGRASCRERVQSTKGAGSLK